MRGNKKIQISGLPEEIVVEILVRISSVKTIALCKSVCKSWRGLISEARFAELHLGRSKICLLVKDVDKEETKRIARLIEDGHRGFHSDHCICGENESCEICRSDTTAITELKITRGMMWGGKFIQNTCNGLLCLFSHNYSKPIPPIVVSNPITGEFIYLPDPGLPDSVKTYSDDDDINILVCGLGLDPKTGRYKVVILYSMRIPDTRDLGVLKAFVHVLGTDSWRELASPDVVLDCAETRLSYPTIFDGALHWVCLDTHSDKYRTLSFDLESEQLRYGSLQSLPPGDSEDNCDRVFGVVVLGGRLCMYHSSPTAKIDMCYSSSDSLPEWILHDLSEVLDGDLQVLYSLDDGDWLMYKGYYPFEIVDYDPPRGSLRFKRMRFADLGELELNLYNPRELQVVAYTPSFLSLKDIMKPGNAQVLDLYSRSENPVNDEEQGVGGV